MQSTCKGFTIVELVIVIAAIAILIGFFLPTLTEVINKARDAAALQWANMAYKEAYAQVMADGEVESPSESAQAYGFNFTFTDADSCDVVPPNNFGYTVTVTDGKVALE